MFEHNVQTGTIIDFRNYSGRKKSRSSVLELAIDKCEEAFMQSDWKGFGYWFAVCRRERATNNIRNRNRSRANEF
jgi:hypothetical protein